MDSLEEIGALLGLVAFLGLAVLVFLTFQQARHIRRLRDWAGRAPERAAAAAAREEAGDAERTLPASGYETAPEGPGRLTLWRDAIADRWAELDRRSPVSPRILLAGLGAVILGLGIATSGFGVLGGDEEPAPRAGGGGGGGGGGGNQNGGGGGGGNRSGDVEVAVLNGTAPPGGTGVAGVANRVGESVQAEGFELGAVDDAGSFAASVVMYEDGADADAEAVAEALATLLGPTETEPMSAEVAALAGGAPVALVVGQDDSGV